MFERFVPEPYIEKIVLTGKSIFLAILAIGFVYWVSAFLLGVELFTF
jgi:hypothetical protein